MNEKIKNIEKIKKTGQHLILGEHEVVLEVLKELNEDCVVLPSNTTHHSDYVLVAVMTHDNWIHTQSLEFLDEMIEANPSIQIVRCKKVEDDIYIGVMDGEECRKNREVFKFDPR